MLKEFISTNSIGDIFYWKDSSMKSFHRENGPAVERSNGYKSWYQNGQYHRLDGPAIEYVDGGKEWYINGEEMNCQTQEQFERIIKLKSFL